MLNFSSNAAGNVTNDTTNSYQWDAEAHLITVHNGLGTAISINTYNALGQRVRDVIQSVTTDEAYGAGGNLLWRYTGNSSTDRSFVPFNGGILAEYWSGGTLFDHPDEIGSTTISSDYTGNNLAERLFYPYGEPWTGIDLNNFNMHQTFAQLPDYDAETDQYNTLNRHYSPSGRWMSPDPGGMKVIHLDAPQTWNLYAYVANNPTTLADPSGLDPVDPDILKKTDPDTEEAIIESYRKDMNNLHSIPCIGCWNPDIRLFPHGDYLATSPTATSAADVEETIDKEIEGLVKSAEGALDGAGRGILGLADVPAALLLILLNPGDLNPVDDVALIEAANKKNIRPSTREDHQLGLARKQRDRGGEKGDKRRRAPRNRPKPQGGRRWKGPWPPKDGQKWW